MDNLQKLQFTRIMPRKDGIFVSARYPDWWSEFSFLIESDGTVKGKTQGSWTQLTQELSEFIKAKVQSILIEKSNLVYA